MQLTQLSGMMFSIFWKTSVSTPSASDTRASVTPITCQHPSATEESSQGEEQLHSGGIQKDPLYYNVSLILLVEGILFKVSRSYFEKHSNLFQQTYLFGPHGEEVPDGLTDQQPLRLDGVDAAEFRCLLKAMIREESEEDMSWTEWTLVLKLSLLWKMKLIQDLALRKIPAQIHNSNGWIAALKISTQFRLQRLRELAIERLTSEGRLTALGKIELGIEYSIGPWLTTGYTEFATRKECISAKEEDRLGPSRTSNLFRVRHRELAAKSSNNLQSDIRNTFASEFAAIAAFDTSPISYLRPDIHTATNPDGIRRDKAYYCVDIIFLIENTLFKLPRYLFEESSEVFRDMFLLPAPEGSLSDGSSNEQPLVLEGVRKAAFRRLLEAMMFPASTHSRSKGKQSQKLPGNDKLMLYEEWVSVLELSSMWQMAKVQEMAVKRIIKFQLSSDSQMDLLRLSTKLGIKEIRNAVVQTLSSALQPSELVQRGIEWRVCSWLFQGYKRLVEAPAGILAEDEKRLGWKTTSKLFRIRDEYLQMLHYDHKGLAPSDFSTHKIKEVFAEELKDAVWDGK